MRPPRKRMGAIPNRFDSCTLRNVINLQNLLRHVQALVVQRRERRIPDPKVGGSIPFERALHK